MPAHANSACGGTKPLEPAVPDVPGHKMLRKIGAGAYGDVWLAHTDTDEYRAVKIVYRSRFPEGRPFVREFEGIKRFEPISRKNPGLVDVLQLVRCDTQDAFYYVNAVAWVGSTNTSQTFCTRPIASLVAQKRSRNLQPKRLNRPAR